MQRRAVDDRSQDPLMAWAKPGRLRGAPVTRALYGFKTPSFTMIRFTLV